MTTPPTRADYMDELPPLPAPEAMVIARGEVVTVERRRPRYAGQGIVKGMGVVLHHWRQSFRKLDDHSQVAGTFTVEYPDERLELPQASRNMPILLYDDENGQELCTSCFQCQRICPPQVIHMTQTKDPETGKAVPAVTEFIIEYDACMSCGFCAEVCPFDAIKMDHEFELSTAEHSTLTVHKEELLRPVSYYRGIAPDFWASAETSAYKKLATNIKRRPGLIGVAPQMVAAIQEARVAEAQAAAAARAAEAAAAPAEPADDLPTDKKARLAAIRARNQAKQADAAPPAEPAPADDLPTDKQARLAAIRARNQAKQTDAAPPAPAEDEPLPTDKQARLAAIRARNQAKQTDAAPPAEPADDLPTDKKARLAAIRARNQAKQTDAAPPAPAEDEPLPTDKQARLAAIRARNQAKQTDAAPPAEPAAPPAPAEDEPLPTDKQARLAAIRARNQAKKAREQDGQDT